MFDKKTNSVVYPDQSKLKAVVIDRKTTIFVDKDQDPDEARRRYAERHLVAKIKI
jgi:hypothetical protein